MNARLKRAITRTLARSGFILQRMGPASAVGGIDLVQDVAAILGDRAQPVLFDVGANVGQTLEAFLDGFSRPIVHAFEPSPKTFSILSERFGSRPGVTLQRLALGDQQGTIPFFVTADDSVNDSPLARVWAVETVEVTVDVMTIDAYCARHAIEAIDFLKIDAQGYDMRVLRGARGLLDRRRVRLFSAEVMLDPMYEGQPTLVDLLTFGADAGYELVGIYDQRYLRNRLNHLNVCFRSRD